MSLRPAPCVTALALLSFTLGGCASPGSATEPVPAKVKSAFQSLGQPPTTLMQRQQNSLGGPLGPAVNLPMPSVDVGQQPQGLDRWRQQYHPDQAASAGLSNLIGAADPGLGNPFHGLRDPEFNDYPMPRPPAPAPDGHGGVTVPPAGQVR